MKTMFIEAHAKNKVEIPDNVLAAIPQKIGLVTNVQYAKQVPEIKRKLSSKGKKVYTAKTLAHEAQILGCDVTAAAKINSKVDAFLYIGSGEFHPMNVAIKTGKTVYMLNPESSNVIKFDRTVIEKIQKRQKAAMTAYYSSVRIGILVSTKPGQEHIDMAISLKKKIEKQGKECFMLLFDTLDFSQLENFNFIDCFVNTACERIAVDDLEKFHKPIVNFDDIQE